jgi:hypothetical protein
MRLPRSVAAAALATIGVCVLLPGLTAAAHRSTGGVAAAFSFPPPGVNSYATENGWDVRWSVQGAPGARQRLVDQVATPNANGGCRAVRYGRGAASDGVASPVHRSGLRKLCHRYRLQVLDGTGAVLATAISGSLRILAGWTGKVDLYMAGVFSTQRTLTWCVGASVQIMLNIVLGRHDHSTSGQRRFMRYARLHDGASGLLGTNALGWRAALNHFDHGTGYHVSADGTLRQAIHTAARRLRLTGHPVGLLVMRGSHAWVMSGFEADADPAVTGHFRVTAVYFEGPLYPIGQSNGFDMPPDSRLTVGALRHFMPPYDAPGTSWHHRFLTVQP